MLVEEHRLYPEIVDVYKLWRLLELEKNFAHPMLITTVRGHGFRCG